MTIDLVSIAALILGVMGALAFFRVSKLEQYSKNKGTVENDFDSLANLEQWNVVDRHLRRKR
ncbi:hypothetical protein [Parvularcula sp. IMCC14364]|uniref:hypothetical protein n=1 Tax=Parvularcula sp. IMCC14364 TaxID=3067902 RepID=UPI0027418A02|nr:hypothetical protein [Parvularcula sp. IMCC14364]